MSKLNIVDLSFCDSEITNLDDKLKGGKGNFDDIFDNFDFPILPATSTPSSSDFDTDSDSIGRGGSVSADSSSLSAFISRKF